MQARIVSEGDVVVVRLAGWIDVESAVPFRKACVSHLVDKKVVFDFKDLSFVGSSGILPFLETMQELSVTSGAGFKFSGVCSEFQRVLSATPLRSIEIYVDSAQALSAFRQPGSASPLAFAVETAPVVHETRAATDASLLSFRSVPEDEGGVQFGDGDGDEDEDGSAGGQE